MGDNMANTPIRVNHNLQGLSDLKVLLFPLPDGAAVNGSGSALSQVASSSFAWQATIAQEVEGAHRYEVRSGSLAVAWGFIVLQDDTDVYYGEYTLSGARMQGLDMAAVEDLADVLESLGEGLATLNGAFAGGQINVISHQPPSGSIVIVRGDTYADANGRPLRWINATGAEWPEDLTDATIRFTAVLESEKDTPTAEVVATRKIEATGSVHNATAPDQEVRCELTPSHTTVEPGLYNYDVEATLHGEAIHTLVTTAPQSLQSALGSLNQRKARALLEILPEYTQAEA